MNWYAHQCSAARPDADPHPCAGLAAWNPVPTESDPTDLGRWSFAATARYLGVKYRRLSASYFQRAAKRLLDIAVSAVLLVVLSPLFAVVALAVKLTDGGPVLFWQTRVGRWGREFPFPKFRSMVLDAERMQPAVQARNHHKAGVTFKDKYDPRRTWVGRLIRRSSIDELPQLWCVLIGQMTLVGPRPAVPREVALYTLRDRQRLDAAPGITGLWQVSGRGDIPFDQQVGLDFDYIERQSLLLDLLILFRTIPAVLSGRGAY